MRKVKTVKNIDNGKTIITKIQPVKPIPQSIITPIIQTSENQMTMLEVTKLLNYHSIHSSLEQSKNWVIDFAKSQKFPFIAEIKKIEESFLGSLGIVCHLRMSGKNLPNEYSDKYLMEVIQKKCDEQKIRQEGNKKDPGLTPLVPKEKINPAISKANNLQIAIDSAFELFLSSDNSSIIVPEMIKNAAKEELDLLAGWHLESWKLELQCLIDIKTSEEMSEAYSNLSAKQINSLKKFYSELINCVINAVPVKKVPKEKKERISKPKIIPLNKLLEKFVFLPSYGTIESFNSKDIFKSTELFLIDIKYNKIIHAVAEENKTFSVKGKTIINLDLEKSEMKRIPKKNLDVVIGMLNKANKINCKKIFDDVKNDVMKFSGRVNEEILLLKQFFN